MALDMSGADKQCNGSIVPITIDATHPLVQLAKALPWLTLMELVANDLKATTKKGCWWMGRKIVLRVHLATYLLQRMFNYTDRQMEYHLKDNAAYQIFSGKGLVDRWHAPDHTKIEEFRNRLSPETHRMIANTSAQIAVNLGFADPSKLDIDSTVQEANITYPSDAKLMLQLAQKAKKVLEYIQGNLKLKAFHSEKINMKKIAGKAKEYFFLAKNKAIEIRRSVFKSYHRLVKKELKPTINLCENISAAQISKLPWNIKAAYEQLTGKAWRYLLDVAHFTRTNAIKEGKILSLHANDVSCIKKNKSGKDKEFGRCFQLGRIDGNFIFTIRNDSVRMEDSQCFPRVIEEHVELFGEAKLKDTGTDKGYWSAVNKDYLLKMGLPIEGLQKPGKPVGHSIDTKLQETLHNRRAGIEPLIGHLKQGGQMGRSRMKTDSATLGAGYGSILGFNLRQMVRHQQGKMKKVS